MSKLIRVGAALGVCVALMGASTSLPAKKVAADKYAKTVCTTLSGVSDAETKLAGQIGSVGDGDPAAFQQQTASLLDTYVSDIKVAEANLKKQTADVGQGSKISKLLDGYLSDAAGKVETAVQKFRAADASSPAFQADVAQLGAALSTLSATIGDPFSKISDQDMLKAFKKEKSCKQIVKVS